MTRDRIFAAARALFDHEGLEGLSIRRIAQAIELTPMAIYRHFADKDALVDALMLDGFKAWEATVAAIIAPDPLDWLERVSEAFLDFALSEPHRFDAAFLLPARRARRYPQDFAEGRSPVVAAMSARIDQAKTLGELDDTPTLEITLALSALSQGLVSMHRAHRFADETAFRALYRISMRHGLDGFRKPAQAIGRQG
jgi:AcrR family transcriptional regulator